ncbi:MAG: Ig-like domain-containing protein [Ginsengibacter sp.]
MKTNIIFILTIFLGISTRAQVYVKNNATGANNGTSWQDAYTNLDSAINHTNTGDIWVAEGIYKPSIKVAYADYKTFTITKKIALYGGFKGFETNISERDIANNITILSGDVGIEGNDSDNTPRVISITGDNVDSSTIIDGFTVTKSYYKNGDDYDNAAIYIWCIGDPVIRNCIVKDNFGFDGAGIYVRNYTYSKPLITNNLITNNVAFEGAGIYLTYTSARVIGNKIVNNKCVGGFSHLSGGGIHITAYTSPYIYGNLIDGNYAGTYGGGISNESNYSVIISNNTISNNTSRDGGGIYVDFSQTQIVNNLIAKNKAFNNGGGMYVNYSFASSSINNTIVSNSADFYGGAVYLSDGNMSFTNTIIFGNPTKYYNQVNSVNQNRKDWYPEFNYCDVENGKQGITYTNPGLLDSIWGTGNLSIDPNFIDTATSNFQLLPQSSCINNGKPDTTELGLSSLDIIGNPRVAYSRIDIGSYEFDSLLVKIPPYVSITSPVTTTYTAPASIILTAIAHDIIGSISKIDFYQNDIFIGTVLKAPYTFEWENVPVGNYSITAKAADNDSMTTISAPVQIYVRNPKVPPAISIINPGDSAIFSESASITITATAEDTDGLISKVEFYSNDSLVGTATAIPYTFTWNNIPAGNYSITAKATDNDSLVTASEPVKIFIVPNKSPIVNIMKPLNDETFLSPAKILITASATDDDGTVSKVEFYNGNALLKTVTDPPYNFSWDNVPEGSYEIFAAATDNNGHMGTSTPVIVKVLRKDSIAVNLSPNPATTTLNISTAGFQQDRPLTLAVIYGGVVLKIIEVNNSSNVISLDVSSLVNGVYTIKIKCGDEEVSKQFVKIR